MGMNTLAPVHERLREARKAAGLTQAEVAAGAGLARETVTRVEVGERPYITARTVSLIAGFLGVHVSPVELVEVAKR